jgi:hypothetical protein
MNPNRNARHYSTRSFSSDSSIGLFIPMALRAIDSWGVGQGPPGVYNWSGQELVDSWLQHMIDMKDKTRHQTPSRLHYRRFGYQASRYPSLLEWSRQNCWTSPEVYGWWSSEQWVSNHQMLLENRIHLENKPTWRHL